MAKKLFPAVETVLVISLRGTGPGVAWAPGSGLSQGGDAICFVDDFFATKTLKKISYLLVLICWWSHPSRKKSSQQSSRKWWKLQIRQPPTWNLLLKSGFPDISSPKVLANPPAWAPLLWQAREKHHDVVGPGAFWRRLASSPEDMVCCGWYQDDSNDRMIPTFQSSQRMKNHSKTVK